MQATLLLVLVFVIVPQAQESGSPGAAATCASVNTTPQAFENDIVTLRGRLLGGTVSTKPTLHFVCVDANGAIDAAAGGFVVDAAGFPINDLYTRLVGMTGGTNVSGKVRGTQSLPIDVGSSSRTARVPFLTEVKFDLSK
jgi:hypothetical protein